MNDAGIAALRKLAVAYFAAKVDTFLSMDLVEIQKMLVAAGMSEAEFVEAMKELRSMAPEQIPRTLQ